MTVLSLKHDRMHLSSSLVPATLQAYADRKNPSRYSFPVCGDIVRRLMASDPELELTDELWRRLEEISDNQIPGILIAMSNDYPGDERLYSFQRVAVAWLRQVRKGILADEQGLGKTVMALCAARETMALPISDPGYAPYTAIISSTAMMPTWLEHVHAWDPEAQVFILEGTKPQRDEIILKWAGRGGYLITNYDRAEIHEEFIEASLVIIDEAHRARNRKTNVSEAMRKIVRRAKYAFLLTASPTVNNLADLWPLLNMCDPQRFGSFWGFVFRFCVVSNNGFGLKIEGKRESEAEALDRILKPYVLMREGMLGLNPSEYRIVNYILPAAQRRLYDSMAKTGTCHVGSQEVEALDVLAQITRLRQIALDPALIFGHRVYDGPSKLDLLPGLIQERGGQVVVFTNYAQLANRAVERLVRAGISATVMTGELSPSQREYSVGLFRSGEARVIVLTHGTGGEGLTLTEADRAIFLDLAWHPAGNAHAAKRIHRKGQTKDTQIIILHSVKTVEDHVRDIISEKKPVTIGELLRRDPDLRATKGSLN